MWSTLFLANHSGGRCSDDLVNLLGGEGEGGRGGGFVAKNSFGIKSNKQYLGVIKTTYMFMLWEHYKFQHNFRI